MTKTYEDFKKDLVENILNYLPEEYKDAKVELTQVLKTNTTMDAIIISKEGAVVSPTIYINDAYSDYENGESFAAIAQELANLYLKGVEKSKGMGNVAENIKDFEKVKDLVFFTLINTKENADMLGTAPHRKFLDLSIIYRVSVQLSEDKEELGSVIIKNGLMQTYGVSEDELYELAKKNTEKLFPTVVQNMKDIMTSIMGFGGNIEQLDTLDEMIENIGTGNGQLMLCVTNKAKLNGAIALTNMDLLSKIAEKIDSDFYILPSSIHEVLIIGPSAEANALAEMVQDVNDTQVSPEERLSYSVYYYSKETNDVTIASRGNEQ